MKTSTTLCLCIYLLSLPLLSWGLEFRLDNPQECQNWGKLAAIVQLSKQKDISQKDVVKEYLAEVKRNPRSKEEVEAVKHLINEVYSKISISVPFMQVFEKYYSDCMGNSGLVYRNQDI